MVATPVLGTGAEMREGSSPFIGTSDVFTELGRLLAPLAQLVQSISFTPRGSEVRILQGAQNGGYSSVGRASVCGSECRGFDSHYSP